MINEQLAEKYLTEWAIEIFGKKNYAIRTAVVRHLMNLLRAKYDTTEDPVILYNQRAATGSMLASSNGYFNQIRQQIFLGRSDLPMPGNLFDLVDILDHSIASYILGIDKELVEVADI